MQALLRPAHRLFYTCTAYGVEMRSLFGVSLWVNPYGVTLIWGAHAALERIQAESAATCSSSLVITGPYQR